VPPVVDRLNRILRSELGSHPPCQQFAWKWSEDLRRVALKTDDWGRPEMEYTCSNGVYSAQQARFVRKQDPRLKNQWVMTMLVGMSADQGHLDATGDAAWIICYDRRGAAVALEPDILPDATVTWKFIEMERAANRRKAADEIRDYIEQAEREKKKLGDDAYDATVDAMSAYLEIPGAKGSTVFQAGIRDVTLPGDKEQHVTD